MAKKFGLGRGLGSIIPPQDENQNENEKTTPSVDDSPTSVPVVDASADQPEHDNEEKYKVEYLEPEKIISTEMQPRQVFEHASLEELVNSIKEHGILEPLIVSPVSDGSYKLVAGERRLRASKIVGLKTVPTIVRTVSEQQRLEISVIENVQRRNLNPLEEAKAYQRLINEFNLTQEEVSKKVGKSRSKIANSLRLLKLPEELKNLLSSGRITEGHAKVLMELDSTEKQMQFVEQILKEGLSVRETEGIVKQASSKPGQVVINEKLKIWSDELSQVLKTKVQIKPRRKGGIIQIKYYGEEELSGLIDRISKN